MHEASLITSLLKIAQKVKLENSLDSVTSITIVAGDIHQIIPQVMQEAFEIIKLNFPGFYNTALIIKNTPVKIRCNNCHQIILLDQPDFCCPYCRSTTTQIISGKELYIESLEAE